MPARLASQTTDSSHPQTLSGSTADGLPVNVEAAVFARVESLRNDCSKEIAKGRAGAGPSRMIAMAAMLTILPGVLASLSCSLVGKK